MLEVKRPNWCHRGRGRMATADAVTIAVAVAAATGASSPTRVAAQAPFSDPFLGWAGMFVAFCGNVLETLSNLS